MELFLLGAVDRSVEPAAANTLLHAIGRQKLANIMRACAGSGQSEADSADGPMPAAITKVLWVK